jgi:putative effector of murein hydrolase
MLAAVVAGSAVATASAVGIAAALGAPPATLASLAPKSVTTPVAMAISERLGGVPSLTAALVIITGVIGALIVTPLMNAMGIRDFAARGFAAGLASHGLGTARAFTVNSMAGVFAGVAMGMNAIVTAVLAPLLMRLF